ncbi:MAG: SPOR domain-containing protein [Rectinema sp.]|uniref:SPOR domain-containing protein n=1 Tax=uncultured spirochete TaxID=156406 RepID=A0A3P3XTA1_9SPIR|nr:exported hypothetical protein [uncultured spirochete]
MNSTRREKLKGPVRFSGIAFLVVSLLMGMPAPSAWGQTYKNLAQARQAATGAKSQDALKTVLLSALPQLSVRDGIMLCEEYESKVGTAFRAELRSTVGGLYLLLGQTEDAAMWYTKAASLDSKYVMEALRLSIAVGDQKSTLQLLKNEALSEESRAMLDVWLSLYDNDYASASAKAKDALARVSDQQVRRELLFLQYIADFGQFGTSHSSLTKDFPSSIESDLVTGKVFPSSWFVLSLGLSWLGTPALLFDFPKKNLPNEENKNNTVTQWLQVGYFSSKDNAERLSKTLTAKNFQTRIVELKNENGDLRWAVHVAAKEDWQKTQSTLKDQGYESYLIGP